MATETTRLFLLFLVMMTALSLAPMLSHAAVFWDDEMESFGSGDNQFDTLPIQPPPPYNPTTSDTSIKFSGAGSLRYNFYDYCQNRPTREIPTPCGGWTDRTFPSSDEHYGRLYIRVSQNFVHSASTGQSKIWGLRSSTGLSKMWFLFYFGLGLTGSMENTPNDGSTSNIPTNMTIPRETWSCVEWHFVANTPGVPNGIMQTWFNGTQTLNRNDVQFRGANNNSVWDFVRLYRQAGSGNVWIDRVAIGNTRIGCLGATSSSDTTRPASPQGLVIR